MDNLTTFISGIIGILIFLAIFMTVASFIIHFRIRLIKWRFRAQKEIASKNNFNILFSVTPNWEMEKEENKWKKCFWNFYGYGNKEHFKDSKENIGHVEYIWALSDVLLYFFFAMPYIFIFESKVDELSIGLFILISFLLWNPLMFFLRTLILEKQGTILLTEENIIIFPYLFSNEYKTYEREDVVYVPHKSVIHGKGGELVMMYYIFYLSSDKRKKIFSIIDGVHGNAEEFIKNFPTACDFSIKVSFDDAPHPTLLMFLLILLIILYFFLFIIYIL